MAHREVIFAIAQLSLVIRPNGKHHSWARGRYVFGW